MKVQSPAKINLFFQILGKRDDGYHNIASLYQAIDLADEIEITVSDVDSFSCSDARLPMDSTNLVIKALTLFRAKTGIATPVKIILIKRIPREAGLGGGSSNAASTLLALNEIFNYPLESDELLPLAAELGSDVSFFLSPGAAYCTGRGEKIKKIRPLDQELLWIVKPPVGLSTAAVYQGIDSASLRTNDPRQALESFLLGQKEYFNDLEASAFKLMPSLYDLKKSLQDQGYRAVLMCGSGSAFFCLGGGTPTVPPDHFVARAKYI
jgi:4-diphosphocytidyl-2-C-methyl-D-erythritol kinase